MPVGPQIRIAVLGCGSIGRRHLRNLQAMGQAELVGFEPAPDRAEAVRKEFGITIYEDQGEALASGVEAALICGPSATHLPAALEAADRGCHLFIEKPVSDSLTGVNELARRVAQRGLIAMVGYNWRFHPSFRQMKDWVSAGAIGRVLAMRVNCGQYLPDWHPWEDYRRGYSARRELGGGILLDSHEIAYVLWLLDDEVTAVSCVADRVSDLEIDTEDCADVVLRFGSGAQANIHLDYLQRPAGRMYEIYGSEGTIRWSLGEDVQCYRAATKQWVAAPLPAGHEVNQMYCEELAHFLDCIHEKTMPECGLDEGVEVLKVMIAAKQDAERRGGLIGKAHAL